MSDTTVYVLYSVTDRRGTEIKAVYMDRAEAEQVADEYLSRLAKEDNLEIGDITYESPEGDQLDMYFGDEGDRVTLVAVPLISPREVLIP